MPAIGRVSGLLARNSSRKFRFFVFWRGDTHARGAIARIAGRFISVVAGNSCFGDHKRSGLRPPLAPRAARCQLRHRPTTRIAIGLLVGTINVALAADEPFNPVRKLTTWYTDRSLIDIEVVGSTSLRPEFHRIDVERVLRFRLERAYVQRLSAASEPGFEIVGFAFDMETGLADSLIVAVSLHGRQSEEIPGVPRLSQSERVRRSLLVSLQSDLAATLLQRSSESTKERKCLGEPLGYELLEYQWVGRNGCAKPSYTKGSKYVARYDNDLMLVIECHEEDYPGFGCSFRFPFEGFSTEVAFHRDHLSKWRELVNRATKFLKSKQYR